MLLTVLGDDDEEIRHLEINKIHAIRKITNECSNFVNDKLDDEQHISTTQLALSENSMCGVMGSVL